VGRYQNLRIAFQDHRNDELNQFRIDPVLDFIEEQELILGLKFGKNGNQSKHPIIDVTSFGSHGWEKPRFMSLVAFVDLQLLPTGTKRFDA
jgi:hypothetical protein